jgi:hypothetical protein
MRAMPARRSRRAWPLVAALAALVWGGCGGDAPAHRTDDGGAETPCVPGSPFEITGAYGVLVTYNTTVDVLGLPLEDPHPVAWILILAQAEQQDLTVNLTARVCDLKIPEILFSGQPQPVTFSAPPGLLGSLPPVRSRVDLGGATTCSAFTSPSPMPVLLGARLADVLTDPLPGPGAPYCGGDLTITCDQAPGTGCICDQEADGWAGATVDVQNAPVLPDLDHVLATMRATVKLEGFVESSDVIRGPVQVTMEQVIIGCVRAGGVCDAAATTVVERINPTIAQDPDAPSSFLAKRLDPSYDCARLVADRAKIFPL